MNGKDGRSRVTGNENAFCEPVTNAVFPIVFESRG